MFVKTAKDNPVTVLVEPTPEERRDGAVSYTLDFSADPIVLDDTLARALIGSHPDLVETEAPEVPVEEVPESDGATDETPEATDELPFVCDQCGSGYKHQGSLTRHEKRSH